LTQAEQVQARAAPGVPGHPRPAFEAGRRIAEASVHRFVADVAAHLRERLKGG